MAGTEPDPPIAAQKLPANIADEMRKSYMDYAMSVIIGRALPDVRDGLKPANRRVLFGMQQMGLQPGRAYRKSAKVATPYLLIAGGTALTVVSLGAASPAGVAAIAAGAAQLGTRAYRDYKVHEATEDAEEEAEKFEQAQRLAQAGRSAVDESENYPRIFSLNWWMGDVDPDERTLLTVGEMM